jgi:hypothetical protein
MDEHYTLPHDEAGLGLLFHLTVSLRRAGHKTRVVERLLSGRTPVVTLVAKPKQRPNRKERGCYL